MRRATAPLFAFGFLFYLLRHSDDMNGNFDHILKQSWEVRSVSVLFIDPFFFTFLVMYRNV